MNKPYFLILGALLALSLPAPSLTAQEGVSETPQEKLAKMRPNGRPKNVVTSFHRRAVDSTTAPWASVGRVNVGGYAHCTGSLVAEDIVLTAAHCLYAKHTGKMAPTGVVHFLAGYAKGEYLAHSKVARYTVGRGFDGAKGSIADNIPHDWALLLLEDPIGADHGFLEIHDALKLPPTQSRTRPRIALPTVQIVTAGYPGDRPHVLSLEEDCEVQKAQARGRILVTNCTAIKGDSGGPTLQLNKGQWQLIGLNIASVQNETLRGSLALSALAFRDTLSAIRKQLAKEKQKQALPAGD